LANWALQVDFVDACHSDACGGHYVGGGLPAAYASEGEEKCAKGPRLIAEKHRLLRATPSVLLFRMRRDDSVSLQISPSLFPSCFFQLPKKNKRKKLKK